MSQLSSRARALVAAGKAGLGPGPCDRERLRDRVFAAAGAAAAMSGAVPEALAAPAEIGAPAAAGPGAVKLAAIGAVVVALGAGALFFAELGPERPLDPAAALRADAIASTEVERTVEAPAAPEIVGAHDADAGGESPAAERESPAVRRKGRALPASAGTGGPSPGPAPAGDAGDDSYEDHAALAEDSLGEELRLLRAARRFLDADDPGAALAVVDEHRRRFPAGELAPEAALVRIDGLCRRGRRRAAEGEAVRAAALWPDAPVALRLGNPCSRSSNTSGESR